MRKVRKIREKLYVYGTGTALPSEHQLKQALAELKLLLLSHLLSFDLLISDFNF